MHSQPPKSPDKGTPPDKGAGGLGDLLPCLSPQPPCQGGQETALLAIPPYHGGVQGDFGNFARVGVIGKCLLISLVHHNIDHYELVTDPSRRRRKGPCPITIGLASATSSLNSTPSPGNSGTGKREPSGCGWTGNRSAS